MQLTAYTVFYEFSYLFDNLSDVKYWYYFLAHGARPLDYYIIIVVENEWIYIYAFFYII